MKKILFTFLSFALIGLYSQSAYAQTGVKGIVKDATTKETLVGATVVVKGTSTGTPTDVDGKFELALKAGTVELEISFVGYNMTSKVVNVKEGQMVSIGTIRLEASAIGLGGISIIADRAKPRETPVAFSNIGKKQLEEQLGSRDIPMAMNVTPSVYATQQGGGAGDARINVRGFNQRNVAIMINGVPVNDMENGWVYWSNWDGIADATSSIQMQRGLSAVNLAVPSIGGTMNILSSPADNKAGGSAKFEYGSGNFMKASLFGHTGLINGKFAASVGAVRKVGNGVIDKTWTDAWAYYLGASYNINSKHRLEVYAMGAPQRHGQNLYKQNIATYSQELANNLGYDDTALASFVEKDRYYNQNWAGVTNYDGQQSFNGKTADRYNSDYLNTRENFYNKPLVNANWYAEWSDKVSQFTTVYYSGGTGGGTGTIGKLYRRDGDGVLGDQNYKFYYGPGPWSYDLDQTILANSGGIDSVYIDKKYIPREEGQSVGVLRNSRNNQYQYGALSKIKIAWSKNFKSQVGIDWRTATIEHYREVRDLLGGQFYLDNSDAFNPNRHAVLGDRIAYNFTNYVDWIGGYFQSEYSTDLFSAYGTVGFSNVKYSHINHYRMDEADSTKALTLGTNWTLGYQAKGGANYNVSEEVNVYINGGYFSKVPIFDAMIDDYSALVADNPVNEKFYSVELGANFASLDDKLIVNGNVYYTLWTDRTNNRSVQVSEDVYGISFITGMDQTHMGVEAEIKYRPIKYMALGLIGSVGDWRHTNDVTGTLKIWDDENQVTTDEEITYYIKDLKVGDAPQTQFAGWVSLFPVDGLTAQVIYRYYANHYADWNPFSRTDENDRAQSWKTPAYGLLDFNLSYDLPLSGKFNVQVFAHAFNLLDSFFVQDALDNSQYNGYYGSGDQFSHMAPAAEVFIGTPRIVNGGVKVIF